MSYDKINHPEHYFSACGIECIDVVERMDFLTGNAMKHLWRAGAKPGAPRVDDLKKAAWYVQRAILLEEQRDKASVVEGVPPYVVLGDWKDPNPPGPSGLPRPHPYGANAYVVVDGDTRIVFRDEEAAMAWRHRQAEREAFEALR